MTYRYTGTIPSEIVTVCGLIDEQIERIRETCAMDEGSLMDLRLILSELLINGCEHGNGNDDKKRLFLSVDVAPEWIDVVVQDEGDGFTYVPRVECCSQMDCGGRGLRIVHELVDEMAVEKNLVHCRWRRQNLHRQAH
ncbi:MAG: ATP-binding protein [Peptoniphilaceae bacterium]|nr:ATP-binding protein [Peptoniphilaceae bacterium]MDY6085719.1 ATP-binding protein [Peptoniphilaceae bacterium]